MEGIKSKIHRLPVIQLRRIVFNALKEAYKSEIIDTQSQNCIGTGQEYADKDDWMESKLSEWKESK